MRSKDYWRHLFEDAAKENGAYLEVWEALEDLSGAEIQNYMLALSTNPRLKALKNKAFKKQSPAEFQENQNLLIYEIRSAVKRIKENRK